jgi:hypothetical protein
MRDVKSVGAADMQYVGRGLVEHDPKIFESADPRVAIPTEIVGKQSGLGSIAPTDAHDRRAEIL